MKRFSSKQLIFTAYALAGVMLCVCVSVKLLQHYSFKTSDFDTGIYANAAWNVANGNGFYSSVLDRDLLSEHFSPITAFFAPLMKLYPTANWLLFAQGFAVGAFFFVLIRLCTYIGRKRDQTTTSAIALGMLLLAFMYWPLAGALYFEFNPSTLAMPLIGLAILALHQRRDFMLWGTVAVLLLTKESALLALVGLGLYAWLGCKRFRLALLLFALSGIMAVIIFKVFIPEFREERWAFSSLISPWQHWDVKWQYLLKLFLPLGFLPLFSWRALLPALPCIALNLLAADTEQFSTQYQFDAIGGVFLLVAAMHGAFKIERYTRKSDGYLRTGLIVCLMLVGVLNGGTSLANVSPASFLPRCWPTSDTNRMHYELEASRKAIGLQPEDGIVASLCLGPHLNFRTRYSILNESFSSNWLQPGDYVFIAPTCRGDILQKQPRFRERLLAVDGVHQVHASNLLEVYKAE